MLSNLPVVRSTAARTLFLASAIITAGLVFWTQGLHASGLTPIFVRLFVIEDSQSAMCALLLLIIAALIPIGPTVRPILRWVGEHPLSIGSGCAALMCAGSLLVYRNHPLAMDEYAQFFQSQVFAHGQLAGQFPAPLLDWLIPTGFQNYFLSVSQASGAVISSYWPSFALLLAPFTLLGIPWACNPLICALTLLVIHRLALRIFADRETAGLAVLLTVASPEFFANGISYYSMPAHLLFNSLYALLLLQPTVRAALLAGIVGSVALTLHNPVPHILFAAPWWVWTATRPGGARLVGCLAAGYAPLCALLGVGWFWFSSDLTHQGMTSTTGTSAQFDVLQRFSNIFSFPASTVLLARTIGIAKIWLWSVPGLLILAGAGALKWRHDIACRIFLASALVTLLGYFLVPLDQGHGWGYRYFHSAWVALPLLAAGALTPAAGTVKRIGIFADDDLRTFVIACALVMLVFGVGFRTLQMRTFIAHDLAQVPAYPGTERRVVIIDPQFSFYGADLVQNDPWLRGNVVRMITNGETKDADMMHRHFPEMRRVYEDRYGVVWSAAPGENAARER